MRVYAELGRKPGDEESHAFAMKAHAALVYFEEIYPLIVALDERVNPLQEEADNG